jgi:DNA invertase Pin-like site-specific DNA recombinase
MTGWIPSSSKSSTVNGGRAAIYCRISQAEDDDQTGVDRQERICRDIAARLKLVVPPENVYIDNSRSAWKRSRRRPGWDAMLEAARQRDFSHIIAYHPDRLMRQPWDLEELLRVTDDQRIILHGEANRRDLTDPDDRFILRIEVAHACRSSDDTSRRLKSAMEDRARAGKPQTGRRRFGYSADGMSVIKDEAAIVRTVFADYLDGRSPVQISAELNERGIATSLGRKWAPGTVRALLDSRHVAAIRVFRGEEIGEGQWPAIVDLGTWREVQERREFRAARHAESAAGQRFYLLRGLVTCKRCGTRMAGSNGSTPSYACVRRSRGRGDEQRCVRRIAAGALDSFVRDAAILALEKIDAFGQVDASTTVRSAESVVEDEADERQLAELNAMWAAREISTPEYRSIRKAIEARIQGRQHRTVVRPVKVLEGITGANAREVWERLEAAGDVQRLNAILRFLFAAVIIDSSKVRGGRLDFDRIDIEPNPL